MYRKATIDDCKFVYELICDMEHSVLPYVRFKEIFGNQLCSRNYFCLVNDQNKRLIGVLNLRFEEQLHHADSIAEIMEFAVDPAFRNKGIGKNMLEQACVIAREYGCTKIEVACNQLREDTHRFYLREGMHNYHFKFSKSLTGNNDEENAIGR